MLVVSCLAGPSRGPNDLQTAIFAALSTRPGYFLRESPRPGPTPGPIGRVRAEPGPGSPFDRDTSFSLKSFGVGSAQLEEDVSLTFLAAAVRACFRADRAIALHLVGGLALDGGDDSSAALAGMFCPHRRRMRRQFAAGIARRELLDRLGPAFRAIQFRFSRGWRSGGVRFTLQLPLLPVLRAGPGIGAAREHQGEKKSEGTACL